MADRSPARSRFFGSPGNRSTNSRQSKIGKRSPRPRLLIVCEGEKTEPNYFLAFKVTTEVYGKGLETIRVVEAAERLNEEKGPFDQIWCVFDRDSFSPDDYDNAIHKIKGLSAKRFRVAYSNEAFELWYLLHFEYLNTAITRQQYIAKLNEHLGRKYNKSSPDNYDLVRTFGDEQLAIRNAEKLACLYSATTPYSQQCPTTTVHELVIELRRILARRAAS